MNDQSVQRGNGARKGDVIARPEQPTDAERISRLAPPGRRVGLPHRYQPSIQLVTWSVALAMCFSTVLVLN